MTTDVNEIIETFKDVIPGNPYQTVEDILGLDPEEQAELSKGVASLIGERPEMIAGFKLGLCTATQIMEKQNAA